jgi:hypothetical protein
MADHSSLKQWIIAIVIVLIFLNFQHNASLLNYYGNQFVDIDGTLPPSHTNNAVYVSTAPRPIPTLVLIDPHFIGGFRNQHMRFVAFVNHALTHNISQILLPSVRWSDNLNKGRSLSHEYLFDVEYWNDRAIEKNLPFLVRYDASILEPSGSCFNITSGLWNGLNEEHLRHNETNLRQYDTNAVIRKSELAHCRGDAAPANNGNATTHLIPIGGGKGAGKFWNDYYKMQKEGGSNVIMEERVIVEQSIFQLLRPSVAIRTAMKNAIHRVTANQTTNAPSNASKFMALHPRVEQDMLTHRCHVHMEQNLTRVFERIETFPAFSTNDQFNYDLIFVAVSAYNVERPPRSDPAAAHLKDLMIGNKNTLIHARHHGVFGGVPMFESGAATAKQVRFAKISPSNELVSFSAESLGVIELVASIIDFFTSVTANVFVGVKGSTFSTDVFAVRHYLNKDAAILQGGNYIIGPSGIEELVGPPRVHSC